VGLWAEKYPEIVRMIAAEGHDVANHGYSHLRMDSLDSNKISSEITQCSSKLSEITGTKVELFRPPYGAYNNNVIKISNNLKHYPIQWNVDSLDWKPGISQQEILSRITSKIKPGSILLFHNDTPHTANLLPTIISNLKKEGYSFKPVSKMILRDNYGIEVDGKQKSKE
jgi:peptidoglycan/xylan/chitin deacetylase (PgdA/CDA1 family)